jgi:hypothetical protein
MYSAVFAGVCVVMLLVLESGGYVVVEPSSPTFDVDVSEWSGANLVTALPRRIYFVYSAHDAALAMENAISLQLKLVVRSGRHQYTGLRLTQQQSKNGSTVDAPIVLFAVLDVSNITGRTWAVDGSVAVGVGERQFQVYEDAARRGYLLPGGTCPTVGISGFALGGGFGFFGRKYSIAADSLVGAEVVLPPSTTGATPRIVNVSASDSTFSDLLWALRGGGNNNVGVVTALRFKLPFIPTATSKVASSTRQDGVVSRALANYTHVRLTISNVSDCSRFAMPLYDSIAPHAPQELYCQFLVYETSCGVYAVIEGNATALNETFQLQRWLTTIPSASVQGEIVTVPYNDFVVSLAGCTTKEECLNRTARVQPDPLHPSFFGAFSVYVDHALGSEGLAALYRHVALKPASLGFLFSEFDPYGPTSAVNAIGTNVTAFPHRNALYHIQFMVYWSHVNETSTAHRWLASTFDTMSAFGNGSYRNYPAVWLPEPSARYYRNNAARLQSIRDAYDPNSILLSEIL